MKRPTEKQDYKALLTQARINYGIEVSKEDIKEMDWVFNFRRKESSSWNAYYKDRNKRIDKAIKKREDKNNNN
jgi:hypothetical protein